jgi:hypothetical protein
MHAKGPSLKSYFRSTAKDKQLNKKLPDKDRKNSKEAFVRKRARGVPLDIRLTVRVFNLKNYGIYAANHIPLESWSG